MPNYQRIQTPGATWFFTVNCANRKDGRLLVENIDHLRSVMRKVKADHPFRIEAMVVMPEHLHAVWTLPAGDADYKTRWSLIKAGFSRGLPNDEPRSESRRRRGERGIWQRRYWEHKIRDENDFRRHVDYIHWNPVKHGWVSRPIDWPWSTFHKFLEQGVYTKDWTCEPEDGVGGE